MNCKKTGYSALPVDENGIVAYSNEDNLVWQKMLERQTSIIQQKACDEFIQGLHLLNLPRDRIPQCHAVSAVLQSVTGWSLEPVPALISFEYFFALLANRRFPAATFIRRIEDLDYIEEPDIFHEIFGHCPLLTNPAYAEFAYAYGKLGLRASCEERAILARLFWFTIEFGLIQSTQGLRIYGGGILSSSKEIIYCLESNLAERRPFDVFEVLKKSYRIDTIQPVYFVLQSFDQLYALTEMDLIALIHEAQLLGAKPERHPC